MADRAGVQRRRRQVAGTQVRGGQGPSRLLEGLATYSPVWGASVDEGRPGRGRSATQGETDGWCWAETHTQVTVCPTSPPSLPRTRLPHSSCAWTLAAALSRFPFLGVSELLCNPIPFQGCHPKVPPNIISPSKGAFQIRCLLTFCCCHNLLHEQPPSSL